ncbi:Tex family protein [Desulfoscipio gibsoniae]|uniref:Transcriptional accessory protein n=1 Tax=Desulfoscipio gibsoniae DSM 7213 TaxID=767817 RepID=R4KIM9_9FIRM|nr:Tex family protein [Desulfoscipio gibsoniae]AGL03038.1 transcriptional accessory protein [Desulfoscipio gibsoniae DSM 7213]
MTNVVSNDILQIVARETGIPRYKVERTVQLLEEGNTVPFIARYRKEATGELDEVQIRHVEELVKFHRHLDQRKAEVLRLIAEQGKLTEELRIRIINAVKLTEVEDLYRPFRQKRKTRAGVARERGLAPLAEYLLTFPQAGNPKNEAGDYLSDAVLTVEDALQGAMDIVAEQVADDPDVRGWVRDYTRRQGLLVTRARDARPESVYRMYYDYQEPVRKVVPHRVLAINRGEREEYLKVAVQVNEDVVFNWLYRRFVKQEAVTSSLVQRAVADAYKRLVAPAVERDIRSELTEEAESRAVQVFARNLRSLLMQPPVRDVVVLAIDPAYRTGCKWAVVDETGKLLETGVVYPTPPQKKIVEAEAELARVVKQYAVQVITIGNGTASRETEQFVADFIKKQNQPGLAYTIVSEAGASVYSASELAAREFPDLDVSARSAVSIARRLQDPLAELVKIEPRAVGVGQYQHDVAPKQLNESLAKVVESAVNYVGVDLNTASASLLGYVAGINAVVAENIVHHREQNGRFINRRQLSLVPRLGPKTFEQCVGFLRISGGENLLDATPIHPESYPLTAKLLDFLGLQITDIGRPILRTKLVVLNVETVAEQLDAGVPTLRDIVESLMRPGRDPREELPPPVFRVDVLSIEDLQPGMLLKGTVRNVVDFGAFVDIGVKNDGLVHISELAEGYVRHPMDVVSVGDVVNVRVLEVDVARHRISLSMRM